MKKGTLQQTLRKSRDLLSHKSLYATQLENLKEARPASRRPGNGAQTPCNPLNYLGIQQGLLSPATASLFLSHPSLLPGTPSLLWGHRISNSACFGAEDLGKKWGVQGHRSSFVSLSLHSASLPFCLRGSWPASGPDPVPEDPSESI